MEGYVFDYRLGYVRDACSLPGFDVFGSDDAPQGRIVTLGGYTTAEQARDGGSWAECLHGRLSGSHQIYNGCTDGYAASQILAMLIREAILLRPRRIICLSGYYDVAYGLGFIPDRADADLIKTHPFVTPGQIEIIRGITPYLGLGKDAVFYGTDVHISATALWLRRMAEMKYLCDEFGIVFSSLLQPCVFSGAYQRGKEENRALMSLYGLGAGELDDICVAFKREYRAMAEGAQEFGYVADLSGIFDRHKDVYRDACHVKDEFMAMLMEYII